MSSLKGLESATARKKKKKNVSKRSITKLLKKHTPPSLPFVSKSPFQSNVISERSRRCYCKKKKKKNVSKRSITKLIKKKHYEAYLSFPRVHFEAMSTLKGLGSVTARKKNVNKRSITKLIKKTLYQAYLSCPRVHFEAMSSLKGPEGVTARKKRKRTLVNVL